MLNVEASLFTILLVILNGFRRIAIAIKFNMEQPIPFIESNVLGVGISQHVAIGTQMLLNVADFLRFLVNFNAPLQPRRLLHCCVTVANEICSTRVNPEWDGLAQSDG